MSERSFLHWRDRYAEDGAAGLHDRRGSERIVIAPSATVGWLSSMKVRTERLREVLALG